jgi:hypothetical protein
MREKPKEGMRFWKASRHCAIAGSTMKKIEGLPGRRVPRSVHFSRGARTHHLTCRRHPRRQATL